MIIRNLTKKYMVIRELLSDDEVREYICYELGTPESTQYCAVCQNLSDVNNKEIRFLMEQLNNEKFSDLTDFFISNNCLYILFKYNTANDLKNKIMSEKCDLSERLEIVKNILIYR